MCTYLPEIDGWRRCLNFGEPPVFDFYEKEEK